MDEILNLLVQLVPLWCILLIVCTGIAMRFYYRRFKKMEDKVEHTDCSRNKEIISETKNTLNQINRSIERIEKILISQDPDVLNQLSVTRSPRQLNPLGKDLFAQSGADKVLEANMDLLIQKINLENPTTAYDVERAAYAVLLELSSEAWFAPIKNYIYNHPVFNGMNLNVETVAFVMSLPLRNEFLKRHPEINPNDYPEPTKGE